MYAPLMSPNFRATKLTTSEMVMPQAIQLFDHSLRAARWKKLVGRLRGQLRRLDSLERAHHMTRLSGRHEDGVRAVPLDCIQGSVDGGGTAFDSEFYPLSDRTKSRWVRVATAILKGKPLPPVELIEVGGRYFVIDGHHRISVARMLKQSHIDAIVTVWDVAA